MDSTTQQPTAHTPEQGVLAEAMRIVRGETIMLPSRKHLKALAELNKGMLEALKDADEACAQIVGPDEWPRKEIRAAIAKAEGRTL